MRILTNLKIISVSALALVASTLAIGQEKIAITGAQIHTLGSKGVISEGTVLIEDGRIKQVLDSIQVPSDFTEVDAKGKVVTPGFVGALTNLGLVEVSGSAGVVDSSVEAHPISTVGAAYDAQYAINSDSSLIDITRLEGFTSAVTGLSRTGQLFNGQGAVISLSKSYENVLKAQAYLHIDVGQQGADTNGESRAALWVALNQSLSEAEFAQNYDFSPKQDWHGMISRADARVLSEVVSGKVPLLVSADRAADIMQVLALKKRFSQLNLVLVKATEGWRVAEQIAKANVPVIIDPERNLPESFDQLGGTLKNASLLYRAGVTIAIGMETHNIRLAPQHAGNAVANGLPHSAAIAALTLNPAKIFGVDEELGSLESGKRADIVIWSGDPLEVTQVAEQVFIEGRAIPMTSRQTQLRDRYLNRDKSKPAQYSN